MTAITSGSEKSYLRFKKPIVTTLNNPISTKELLTRLQLLADELASMDQEKLEVESLKNIPKDLVNKKLLKYANTGVQAYVCCALADILRIYAPDAPYTATELSRIFKAFFHQLKKLSDPENPYYQQQCYLLKRLAEVRSVILITDLPDAQELIELLFRTCYELSAKNISTKLEPLIADILSEVISESDIIPQEILKLILNQFLTMTDTPTITSASNSYIYNPALNFSVTICENNADRMSRQIAQFFSEILYDSTVLTQKDEGNEGSNSISRKQVNRTKAIEHLRSIHNLSVQIWKAVPELLDSVMCLIDDELNVDDEKIRALATETIGKMIGSTSFLNASSKINFVVAHKGVWLNWLKKTLDVSPIVRCKWIEQLPQIINSQNSSTSTIINELSNGVTKCLLDTEERVRLTTCISMTKITFEKFTSKVCTKNVIQTLLQLIREKSSEIRNEVIKILGNLYNQFVGAKLSRIVVDFGNNSEEETKSLEELILNDIPNQILSLIYINDKSITASVDLCLFEKLLPFENSHTRRVERLCQFCSCLNDKSKKSFFAICKRQQQISKVLLTFIDYCEEYSNNYVHGEEEEEKENFDKDVANFHESSKSKEKNNLILKLTKIINWLSNGFPEGLNSYSCFERFYKLKNHRFLHLVRVCLSLQSDYATLKNSMKELLTKLTNAKNIKKDDDCINVTTTDMVSNFKLLMYRSSIIFINTSNMPDLIGYVQDVNPEWNHVAIELMNFVSRSVPDVLSLHAERIFGLVSNTHTSSHYAESMKLKIVYNYLDCFSEQFPSENDFVDTLKTFAVNGSPREARFAVKILGCGPDRERCASDLLSQVYPPDLKLAQLATHLSTYAELFFLLPTKMEELASDITVVLIKDVLLENGEDIDKCANEDVMDREKLEDNFQDFCLLYEKFMALHIFVNRLESFQLSTALNEDENEVDVIALPIFKLLTSIISRGGEIAKNSDNFPTPKSCQSFLRVNAGSYLLKLAKCPLYNKNFDQSIMLQLAYLIQDQNEKVRSTFLGKLQKRLSDESISEKFLVLIFFAAHEPKLSLRFEIISWIKSIYHRQDKKDHMKFERCLVRLVHIIAHNEEFRELKAKGSSRADDSVQADELVKAYSYALGYITFFLDGIAETANSSLLYYLASRVKQYRDATAPVKLYETETTPESARDIYCVAELAQLAIRELCELRNWALQTWPGKIQLPSDLFAPMTSTKEAHDVITTVYIPDLIQARLRVVIRERLTSNSLKKKRTHEKKSKNTIRKKRTKRGTASISKKAKANKTKTSHETTGNVRRSARATRKVQYAEESGSEHEVLDKSDGEFE